MMPELLATALLVLLALALLGGVLYVLNELRLALNWLMQPQQELPLALDERNREHMRRELQAR